MSRTEDCDDTSPDETYQQQPATPRGIPCDPGLREGATGVDRQDSFH